MGILVESETRQVFGFIRRAYISKRVDNGVLYLFYFGFGIASSSLTFKPTFSHRSKAVLADSDNDDGSADEEISNIAGDVANKSNGDEEPIISDEEEVARGAIQ